MKLWNACPGGLQPKRNREHGCVGDGLLRMLFGPPSLESMISNSIQMYGDLLAMAVIDSDEEAKAFIAANPTLDVEDALRGYLAALLWTTRADDTNDSDDTCLDARYDIDDISEAYKDRVREELTAAAESFPLAVRMYLAHRSSGDFGHDFLLTRDGHGVGFWDRGLGELGDYLTRNVKPYGESEYPEFSKETKS